MPPMFGYLRPTRRIQAAVCLLLAFQALLLLTTAWDKSDTIDESTYLATSFVQWTRHDFKQDSPPLPKWAFAAAIRISDPQLFDPKASIGRHPLWSRPEPQMRRNLMAARLTTILVTLLAGLMLWQAGRAFGERAGLAALALWCLSPSVLANGSLATLDGWTAAMICAVLWAALRGRPEGSLRQAALAGIFSGLAAACKVTALAVLPPLCLALAWWSWRRARSEGRDGVRAVGAAWAVVVVAMALTLWAVHLFHVGQVNLASPLGAPTSLPDRWIGPLPFPEWWAGLLAQWRHGQGGHLSYLFGETGSGWWWFYLAALLLKTPIGVQILAALRLYSWPGSRPDRRSLAIDGLLLAYPVILLIVLSLGETQLGLRYLLPAFPPAILWLARGVEDLSRRWGRRGIAAAVGALFVCLVEVAWVHPHHLMFFNLWAGGPSGGPRYLIVGDDWGQDQRRLGEWQRQNRPWRLFYTYYSGDPAHWGIAYEAPTCQPVPGWYALQAIEVHRPKRFPPGCLDWLTVDPPDARLGYSIYLYRVNKQRIIDLGAKRASGAKPFWKTGADAPPPEPGGAR